MMGMEAMSNLAHHVEDMFFLVRENPKCIGGNSESVFDLVFQSSDSFKREIESITANADFSPENDQLIHRIMMTVANLKGETSVESTPSASVVSYRQTHYVKVFFEDDCQMENIRAFMLLAQLKELCDTMDSTPAHPEQDSGLSSEIVKNGLLIAFTTTCPIQDILGVIENSINIKSYELLETAQDGPLSKSAEDTSISIALDSEHKLEEALLPSAASISGALGKSGKQSLISVNQLKLDQLMDIVGGDRYCRVDGCRQS